MSDFCPVEKLNTKTLCEETPFSIIFDQIHIEVIRVTKVFGNLKKWQIPFHAHESYEFHYVSAGMGNIKIEDNIFSVKEGDFYITAPYVRHNQRSSEESIMEEYCIECKIDFLYDINSEEFANEITSEEVRQLKIFLSNSMYSGYKYTNEIIDDFKKLENIDKSYGFGQFMITKTLLINILIKSMCIAQSVRDISRPISPFGKENAKLIKIKNYLDGNLCSNITIYDAAKFFYISPRQLDRIIMKGYGVSFHCYLTKLRMNMAIRLLEQGDDTITNIALNSGFSSYQHLYRVLNRNGYDYTELVKKIKSNKA